LGRPVVPDVHHDLDRIRIDRIERNLGIGVANEISPDGIAAGVSPQHDHGCQFGQIRPDALDHSVIVEAPELGGNEDHPAAAVVKHELHFAVTQDRQDGVQHQAHHARRQIEAGSLRPVGQLHGDHIARLQPALAEEADQ
jgi:hypothetical protein